MEEGKKLSKRLYLILILILGYTVYQLFNTIYLDITAEKLSNKNFTYDYKKKYKADFTIPVDIYCMMGDTTINYIGENSSGVISSTMLNDTNRKKQYNEIKNNKTYKKDYYTSELSVSDNKLNKIDNSFEELNIIPTNGVAVLNPKNTKDKIALYLVKYFTYVFIIIILYQFLIIFKNLKNNFKFNEKLKRKFNVIGYLFIFYNVYQFIIKAFYQSVFHNVSLYSKIISEQKIFRQEILYAKPENLNIDLTYMLLGMGIIVLSKLFEYGNTIQKQNELTI